MIEHKPKLTAYSALRDFVIDLRAISFATGLLLTGCVGQNSLPSTPSSSGSSASTRTSKDSKQHANALVVWPSAASDPDMSEKLFGAERKDKLEELRRVHAINPETLEKAVNYSEKNRLIPFSLNGQALPKDEQERRAALVIALSNNQDLLLKASAQFAGRAANLSFEGNLYLCDKIDLAILAHDGVVVFTPHTLGAFVLRRIQENPAALLDLNYPGIPKALADSHNWPETTRYMAARSLQVLGERYLINIAEATSIPLELRQLNSIWLVEASHPNSHFTKTFAS